MPSGPEDYRCHYCRNLVLYRHDHTTDCVYYVSPLGFTAEDIRPSEN